MQAVNFLVSTLFDLYVTVVMLRFMLQLVRADFYNPISQFIVKVTNPVLVPFRRLIPGIGGIDWSSLVLAFVIMLIKIFTLTFINVGISPDIAGYFIAAFFDLLNLSLNIIFFIVLVSVLASWIAPGNYNPALNLLNSITDPLLAPIRKVIPPIAGLDLSPLVLLIALQFVSKLLMF